MSDTVFSREEFLKSGLRKISDFINILSELRETHKSRQDHIRPPGSLRESSFLQLCNRCGLCEEVCPKKIIILLDTENTAERATPAVIFSKGQCDFCLKCIDICKTGALQPPHEKNTLKLGLAVIDPKSCLSWGKDIICNICKFKCPQRAIEFENNGIPYRPVVNPAYCNGCGLCQYICPSNPKAVWIANVKRLII